VSLRNVFVVEHDEGARTALSRHLNSFGFAVRAFNSAESFLAQRPASGAACLVLNDRLPGLSGLELQRRLQSESTLAVVFVTGHGDVRTVVQAMKRGAIDFLTKPVDAEQLVAAVTRGLEQSARTEAEQRLYDVFVERVDRLTRREREVATALTRGLHNRQIALELGTTERTVKAHRGRVMAKLEVGSVAQLVRLVENARRGDALTLIDSATRPTSGRPFETRRIHWAGNSEPKWRSTC
jgi:FixJ family two-component response regulator